MSETFCKYLGNNIKQIKILMLTAVLVGLYFTSSVNYLLFHSLAEIFSIVVAFSVFAIAWNSQKYIENHYLLFISIAYLFIAVLDLLHTLAYKGMPIFTGSDFYANQLWIGARYMESLALLFAVYYLYSAKKIDPNCVVAAFTGITALVVMSIFVWKVFPECFVEGQGLTPFKKVSEYIICLILTINIILLRQKKEKFEPTIYRYLLWGLIFTIIAELAFTFYISNYGLSNLIGHYFKILSFYMVYLAIIATGIENPFNLIFLELDRSNKQLKEEITTRKKTEAELKKAIAEIKILQGILPVCAYCKNIRDDKGAWSQIEAYISTHSEAKFSHSICPVCLKNHHPDLHASMVEKGKIKE